MFRRRGGGYHCNRDLGPGPSPKFSTPQAVAAFVTMAAIAAMVAMQSSAASSEVLDTVDEPTGSQRLKLRKGIGTGSGAANGRGAWCGGRNGYVRLRAH